MASLFAYKGLATLKRKGHPAVIIPLDCLLLAFFIELLQRVSNRSRNLLFGEFVPLDPFFAKMNCSTIYFVIWSLLVSSPGSLDFYHQPGLSLSMTHWSGSTFIHCLANIHLCLCALVKESPLFPLPPHPIFDHSILIHFLLYAQAIFVSLPLWAMHLL